MSFGVTELLIILAIILLLFGTSKLKSMGSDLGSAIKGFRKAVTTEEEDKEQEKLTADDNTSASEPTNSQKEKVGSNKE